MMNWKHRQELNVQKLQATFRTTMSLKKEIKSRVCCKSYKCDILFKMISYICLEKGIEKAPMTVCHLPRREAATFRARVRPNALILLFLLLLLLLYFNVYNFLLAPMNLSLKSPPPISM